MNLNMNRELLVKTEDEGVPKTRERWKDQKEYIELENSESNKYIKKK